MRRTVTWTVAAALLGATTVVGCGSDVESGSSARNSGAFPMTVNNCGHRVTLRQPPEHVFAERDTSVAVAAAGGADRLVARSGESGLPLGKYAEQLQDVPEVTPDTLDPPSTEVVLNKGADLVIAAHVTRQDVQALNKVGVPVLVPAWFCQQVYGSKKPVTFQDTYRTLRQLGTIFGTRQSTAATIADLTRRVTAVRERFASEPPRSAANVYVSSTLLQAYGRLSANNTVLRILGLHNVFPANARSTDIGSEELLHQDPAVLILSYGPNQGVKNAHQAVQTLNGFPGLRTLRAQRDHRVAALDFSYLTGGPLTVDGLEQLADQLSPNTTKSGVAR